MKKLLILVCVLTGSFMTQPIGLWAQPTTAVAPTTLDAKTQKKVDQAKVDLVKDQKKLTKTTGSYKKEMEKFEKNQSKGKLSPDKISKGRKALENIERDIAKLKKGIADNQALIDKYMMPAKPNM